MIKQQEEGIILRPSEAKQIARFVIVGEELYRRGYAAPMMKCLAPEEADYVMRKLHEGICRWHMGGRALRARVLRAGLFWITMEKDAWLSHKNV